MTRAAAIAQELKPTPRSDKPILWAVLALSAVGVVAVYSAVTFLAKVKQLEAEDYLMGHLMRLGLSLGVMFVASRIRYTRLLRWSKLLLIGAIVLLVAVQIAGVASGGAQRWLRMGGFGFQPSDLARIGLLLHLSVMLSRKQEYIGSLSRAFVPLFFWVLLVVSLIGMENLSTALLLLMTAGVMCFVGRVRVAHLAGLAGLGAVLAVVMLLFSPARAARVESFVGVKLFPHTSAEQVFDDQDEGYQAQQALIAFAMGGLTGVGPGKSVQRDFLPAPYNDFIFAIVAEEYGMLAAFGVLAAFVLLLVRGYLRVARRSPEPAGLFLAVGITTQVVLYAFVHAGVTVGLLPVTGLPLPFVSWGGTSLVATGALVGILLNISRHSLSETGTGA